MVFESGGSLEALVDPDIVDIRAAGPSIMKRRFAVMQCRIGQCGSPKISIFE